jgi:hypothetical protein
MSLIQLKADQLVLGDRVRLFDDPYGWGTVVNLRTGDTDDLVEIFRPYVHVGDFEYTGGVLHYIGSEMVKVWRRGHRVFEVDAYTHQLMLGEGAIK